MGALVRISPGCGSKIDQRSTWWRRFGEATGRPYEGLPADLASKKLEELTDQPLLNYLLALSYVREELDFSTEPNLNQIYRDLLAAVYERGWDRQKGHPATEGLEEEQFIRILEEIALAVWHGDGRKATVRSIEESCKRARLNRFFERFAKGAEEGVTQLLTAFYFRQHGQDGEGDRTFEFTHKSFGEYLTARRIVRQIEQIDHELAEAEKNLDRGIDEQEALVRWAQCCGPAKIDGYLYSFVAAEVALKDLETCARWQKRVLHLIGHLLRQGMPMTKLDLPNYLEMKIQARNAEEALLVVHSACAQVTEKVYKMKWPSRTAAGDWIHQLRGQRDETESTALSCLHHLDLSGQTLFFIDLYRAILDGARLDGAILDGAILDGARLHGARLHGAILDGAILDGAILDGARLEGASLDGAILDGASLDGASLHGASLHGASLDGASLHGVHTNSLTSFKNTRGEPASASTAVRKKIREGRG